MKREDYISWDEYFMGIAMLAARTVQQGDDLLQILLGNLLPDGNVSQGHIAIALILGKIQHHTQGIAPSC